MTTEPTYDDGVLPAWRVRAASAWSAATSLLALALLCVVPGSGAAQQVAKPPLSFTGDFRFRAEGDWDSRKSNATYRDDRSRLRVRARAGLRFQKQPQWELGLRLRTGVAGNPQDPQVTLGSATASLDLLPLGIDRAYFRFSSGNSYLWFGKNDSPFAKNSEMFWSDNVNPDGVAASWRLQGSIASTIDLRAAAFVLNANGQLFNRDAGLGATQVVFQHAVGDSARLHAWLGFFRFTNLPNRPSHLGTWTQSHSILAPAVRLDFGVGGVPVHAGIEGYRNLADLAANDSIPKRVRRQTSGANLNLEMGRVSSPGDWGGGVELAYLPKYVIVDYLAQNDWARWDYSGVGSPAGRLSNLQGAKVRLARVLYSDVRLTAVYYMTRQIELEGLARETGQRLRVDIDVKF